MNKRKLVREWLNNQDDKYTFSIPNAAKTINVTPKDVSNIVFKLFKNGALSRSKEGKHWRYIVNANILKKELKKTHTRGERIVKPAPKKADHRLTDHIPSGIKAIPARPLASGGTKDKPIAERVRKSPRSSFVMALDNEIKELEDKIKQLRTVRKNFV